MKETSEWTEENICCTGLVTFLKIFSLFYLLFSSVVKQQSRCCDPNVNLIHPEAFFSLTFFGHVTSCSCMGKVNNRGSL